MNSINSDDLLFNQIKLRVIEKELEKQRKCIQENVFKQEKGLESSQWWNKIIKCKFLKYSDRGVVTQKLPTDYLMNQLPFDNVNGYNSTYEYDNSCYLTKLLISSHNVDSIFQQECAEHLNFSKYDCDFCTAPVKTKARCQRKAELEYCLSNKHEWPYTKNIIDLVRCSVVFKNSKELWNGINGFLKQYNSTFFYTINSPFVIKQILRIKNGFCHFHFNTEI